MHWADWEHSEILENCPYKARYKKIEWLMDYWRNMSINDDDVEIYEPADILYLLMWLGLTEPSDFKQDKDYSYGR